MSAQTQKHEYIPMDVIQAINYFCYYDHSRFYDEYLRDCSFSKPQFKQMMRHDPCHARHYRELIMVLPKVEERIHADRPTLPKVTLVWQHHVDDANSFNGPQSGPEAHSV